MGRLAQLVERFIDIEKVIGPNPIPPTHLLHFMPLPQEIEHPDFINQSAKLFLIERQFIYRELGPYQTATSVLGREDVTKEVFDELGLPYDLKGVHVIATYTEFKIGIGSVQYREIETKKPDIYIRQMRKYVTAKNVEELRWGFTSLYKLGAILNELYREKHRLAKV